MSTISSLAIPILILTVVLLGLINKVKIYDAFLEGAKKGLNSTVAIIPPIVGLLSAVYMFRASGAVDLICKALKPVVEIFHIPYSKSIEKVFSNWMFTENITVNMFEHPVYDVKLIR